MHKFSVTVIGNDGFEATLTVEAIHIGAACQQVVTALEGRTIEMFIAVNAKLIE